MSFTRYFCLNCFCVVKVKWSKVWLYQWVVYCLVVLVRDTLSTLVWNKWPATKGTKMAKDVKKERNMVRYILYLKISFYVILPGTRGRNLILFRCCVPLYYEKVRS